MGPVILFETAFKIFSKIRYLIVLHLILKCLQNLFGSLFLLFSSGLFRSFYENNGSLIDLFCWSFLFLEQCFRLSLSDEIGCTFFDIDNFSIIPKYLFFDIDNWPIIWEMPIYRLSIIFSSIIVPTPTDMCLILLRSWWWCDRQKDQRVWSLFGRSRGNGFVELIFVGLRAKLSGRLHLTSQISKCSIIQSSC